MLGNQAPEVLSAQQHPGRHPNLGSKMGGGGVQDKQRRFEASCSRLKVGWRVQALGGFTAASLKVSGCGSSVQPLAYNESKLPFALHRRLWAVCGVIMSYN